MAEFTISYSQGWPNWYVSEFYKFFHVKLEEIYGKRFEYVEPSVLNAQYNIEKEISSDSLFGHYSLVIKKNSNDKYFVHSWYDHAFATLEWCIRNNFDIILFSAVSNITDDFIKKHSCVKPSVYCLENWSDLDLIEKYKLSNKKQLRAYFAGLSYGIRTHFIETLCNNKFFDIKNKSQTFIQKEDYYKDLANSYFGVSLNGAANICYRDLELLGIGTINLRQKLICETHDPLIPFKHYYNFFDDVLVEQIIAYHAFNRIDKNIIADIIQDKVNGILDFIHTEHYDYMIQSGREWYISNCTPLKQFQTLNNFLQELSIFN